MAKASASTEGGIPVTTLCKAVGIKRWKYPDWQDAHFAKPTRGGCTDADAVEAAVILLLTNEELDRDDVLGIIESVRTEVRQLDTNEQVDRVRLVCNLRGATGVLIFGDDDAAVARAIGSSTPGLAIELFPKVAQVKTDFRHRASLPKPNTSKGGKGKEAS